jgi:hypothetical protein
VNKRHGSPYDRGSADSYYRRDMNPHYYVGDTYFSELVKEGQMTSKEIAEYVQGFNDNEASMNFKEY